MTNCLAGVFQANMTAPTIKTIVPVTLPTPIERLRDADPVVKELGASLNALKVSVPLSVTADKPFEATVPL